jgi:hypothetical protein
VLNWILRVLGFNTSILEEILSTLTDLKTQINDIKLVVDEIKADLADLISKLPSEGGLTAAEVEELKADLGLLKTKADDAADDWTQSA